MFLISRVGIGLVGVDSRWIFLMWVGAVLFQYSFHWDIIVSLASFSRSPKYRVLFVGKFGSDEASFAERSAFSSPGSLMYEEIQSRITFLPSKDCLVRTSKIIVIITYDGSLLLMVFKEFWKSDSTI